MSSNNNPHAESFADYLQSMDKLNALEKMTANLDRELCDSQNIMKEIKTLFDSIPNANTHHESQHEELARFVKASTPKLLLSDMIVMNNVEIDKIVTTMKEYAEIIRKNLIEKKCKVEFKKVHVDNVDLTPCATSLNKLSKCLAKVKITEQVGGKNAELEGKLHQLCEDVTLFTQMVHVNGRLAENIHSCCDTSYNLMVAYENIINRLLTNINEATYLLKNN